MATGDSPGVETLLIGLDGACVPVLTRLFDAGCLPALEALFADGVAGELTSQLPPWTPSAWPSLYTGVNPGKHGVFDFLEFDGYDWRIVDRTSVNEHALWELLDLHGLRSVVVNVPVTAPARPFDGALLPGYVGPEAPRCHPDGLLDELRADLGEYRVYKPLGLGRDERVAWYERLTRLRGRAFRLLLDRYEPDFGFLQFQQTDSVFHELPGDEDAVRAVFGAVDREIAAVLDRADPTTVLVVSDHGIGPYDGPEFRVNQYLRGRGLVRTRRGAGGMPSWTALSRAQRRGTAGKRELLQRLLAAASAVGITSQRLGTVLEWFGLRQAVLDRVSPDAVRAGSVRVDFARSRAYMRSRTEMGVRINLAGRDPSGTVTPEEYEAFRDSLIGELAAVTGPDGAPVFDAVVPGDAVFEGPYVDEAVDIVTVPRAFDTYLSASVDGAVFGDPSEPWNHKRDGVIAATGDIGSGEPLGDAHLFDIAPTVLSSLGVPPSDRMDGRPLPFVDPVASVSYPPFEPTTDRVEAAPSVEHHLADMGYLEGPV